MYMTKDLDRTIKEFSENGYKVFQSATFSSGGAKIRYAYMGKDEDGLIFEFVECSITKHIKKAICLSRCKSALLRAAIKKSNKEKLLWTSEKY